MNRFWLKSYPEGVSHDIDLTQYDSVVDMLTKTVNLYSDRPSFSNFGTGLTFAELEQKTRQFGDFLQNQLGMKKGDRLAIMLPNILQYPIALFGAMRIGVVVVNVDPMYTKRELVHQLNDSGADTLLFLQNFVETVDEAMPEISIKHVISTQIGDCLNFPKSVLINFVLKHVKKMVPNITVEGAISFNQALASGAAENCKDAELHQDDIAFLQYTGGTTGVSKGAILTHKNMLANMLQAREWLSIQLEYGHEKVINALPLYHIFSLTANALIVMSLGGENVLITNPRDFKGFVKILQKQKFTVITAVNTLFRKLLDTEGFDQIDFSRLRLSLGGGMAITTDVASDWKKRTGSTLIEAYGLTECAPALSANPTDLKHYNGKIGLPLPSTLIEMRDVDGAAVAVGEPGELCAKGPQVTQGYWNLPQANEEAFTDDGFFKTGDYACFDEDGYIQILDRKKDMILVSGFNVYPNEIDDVVSQHPGVSEAAAVGKTDPVSGEVVKLFVVKSDPDLSVEALMDYCQKNLTGYKRPREICFIDELPKSNVGKVLRKNLR